MRQYSDIISLNKNKRGVYSLDTIIGCKYGMEYSNKGCYDECYAAKSALIYGYDFSKSTNRYFKTKSNFYKVIKEIKKSKLDFIRIGSNGDPSEDWGHTLDICKKITPYLRDTQLKLFNYKCTDKTIVIITKHFNELTKYQVAEFAKLGVVFNTSISAIDNEQDFAKRLFQYNRLKKHTKSILRVVTFSFNKHHESGKYYDQIQKYLLSQDNCIDTVFRCTKSNPMVKEGLINVKQGKFLGNKILISKENKKTYMGKCDNCLEMCGAKM